MAIIVLGVQNWKIHRTPTRVFCLIYAGYLIFEASITLSEPATATNILSTIITVGILCPLIITFARLLRLGDFFRLSIEVKDLRNQLRRSMNNSPDIIDKLNRLNERIELTLDEVEKTIRSPRQ